MWFVLVVGRSTQSTNAIDPHSSFSQGEREGERERYTRRESFTGGPRATQETELSSFLTPFECQHLGFAEV